MATRIAPGEAAADFAGFMPSEQEWYSLLYTDIVDCTEAAEKAAWTAAGNCQQEETALDDGIVQLLGADMGLESEDLSEIDKQALRIAQLFNSGGKRRYEL